MKIKVLATIGEKAMTKLGPLGATIAKNSPKIFMWTGIASVVSGEVLTGWATLKAKKVLDEKLDENLTEDEQKRIAISRAAKVAGYYAPTVITTGIGIAFIVKGNHIQEARVMGAMAAYSALNAAFNNYRGNVVAEQGPNADYRYYTGSQTKKTDIFEEPEEEGKKAKKSKQEVVFRDRGNGSPYTAIFDDVSADWTSNREQNLFFLKSQCVAANLKLQRRGYLFLNEVLDMLGLPYNPAGQFVGWIDEAYEGSVDGIVDFGIDMAYLEAELDAAQLEGRNPEPSIWLDFNVDGEIWDKIPLVRKQMR